MRKLRPQGGHGFRFRNQRLIISAHCMDEFFKAAQKIEQARIVAPVQQLQRMFIIFAQMLQRAGLGAQFFKLIFLSFFR